jgi:hypothetical protein
VFLIDSGKKKFRKFSNYCPLWGKMVKNHFFKINHKTKRIMLFETSKHKLFIGEKSKKNSR